jgi:hypothetical protein
MVLCLTSLMMAQGHRVSPPFHPMDMNSKSLDSITKTLASPRRDEIVVFWIIRDSVCAECGEELGKGNFLRLEAQRPLCLACADLDHLVFLTRGDAALTRRATRYSTLRAVVVRFSRSRKRYERQGVLVEEQGLARAEQECLSDAKARELARERAAERRRELDAEYVAAFARRVGELFPGCPVKEQQTIAEHACQKYSGRVGRSAAAKELQSEAVELAVRAHVRHVHTRYDEILARGVSRQEARAVVGGVGEQQLKQWQRRET